MDSRDPHHQWHHSDHRALEASADRQEIEEMIDAELDIRWSSRHQSNEGDLLHQGTEGGHNHLDATPHLG
eukprot:2691248-Amphidinium_carterae.1